MSTGVFRAYRTDRTRAGPSIASFVRFPLSKLAIRGTPFHRQRSPVGLPSSSDGSALGFLPSFRSSSCTPRASIAVFPRFTDPPFRVAKHEHVASSLGRVDATSTTPRLRNGTKHPKKKREKNKKKGVFFSHRFIGGNGTGGPFRSGDEPLSPSVSKANLLRFQREAFGCPMTESNCRPFACEANVITNYTNRTQNHTRGMLRHTTRTFMGSRCTSGFL